jgi:hypothetical protein
MLIYNHTIAHHHGFNKQHKQQDDACTTPKTMNEHNRTHTTQQTEEEEEEDEESSGQHLQQQQSLHLTPTSFIHNYNSDVNQFHHAHPHARGQNTFTAQQRCIQQRQKIMAKTSTRKSRNSRLMQVSTGNIPQANFNDNLHTMLNIKTQVVKKSKLLFFMIFYFL